MADDLTDILPGKFRSRQLTMDHAPEELRQCAVALVNVCYNQHVMIKALLEVVNVRHDLAEFDKKVISGLVSALAILIEEVPDGEPTA